MKVLGKQTPASPQAASRTKDASCRGSCADLHHGLKAAGSVGQARTARLLLACGDATSGGAVDNAILPASSCTETVSGRDRFTIYVLRWAFTALHPRHMLLQHVGPATH